MVFVPSWWSNYEGSRFLVTSSPIVFGYRSTFVLRAEHRGIHLHIAVVEHGGIFMFSFFTTTIVGGPDERFHVL